MSMSDAFVPTARRQPRDEPKPTISFVILASRTGRILEDVLGALTPRIEAGRVEVVVAHPAGLEAATHAERHPGIRWVVARDEASIAELRELGMREAEGDVVHFVDEGIPSSWPGAGIK